MKIEDIEKLIRLVSENELDSFEMKSGGVEIRITRDRSKGEGGVAVQLPTQATAVSLPVAPAVAPTAGQPAEAAPAAPPGEKTPEQWEEEPGIHVIRATMVGTYYKAASPGADPFVQEGSNIRKGQVICIIEAMKIMNEIEAEVAGKVVKVFAEDTQPVEYGEALMAVSTA